MSTTRDGIDGTRPRRIKKNWTCESEELNLRLVLFSQIAHDRYVETLLAFAAVH